MSKKRAGSASRPGTPANDGDSGSEDDFKPQQAGGKGKQAMQGSKSGTGAGVGASGSGGANGAPAGADDDMNTLDDAVGYAGVDLNAEEEAIKASNYRTQQQQQQNRVRVRPRLVLDEQALKDVVLRIAASYQLKNLESDSLPLIGLAVQMRMRALIERMIEAKEYRSQAHHLRPPPMYEATSENDTPAPMWDAVIYDDVEKILSTFDRVEREEERQARKDRLARDQAEQEERERLERMAQDGDGEASTSMMGGDVMMAGDSSMGTPGSMPGTPRGAGSTNADGSKAPKEKKRKKETPMQTAKNMSEDVRKRLSDQTASRKLGTKKFAWLSGGAGGASSGLDSPLNKKTLPRPKFPPLPPSNLSISTSANNLATISTLPPLPGAAGLDGGTDANGASNAFGRLTGIPAAPEASRAGPQSDDPANRLITIRDALFVMETERGKGGGQGSGTRPMTRAYMGRT